MTDPNDPRAKLLAETLQGDWADGPAAAMARRAAAHARRRRVARGVASTLGVATVAAVFLFAFARQHSRTSLAPGAALVAAAQTNPGYEIISDDELITLLRDRPLLVLPQENGGKKFVVLDR